MRRITTKQRLSLIFGSYVFAFIVIIAIAVYYLFNAVVIAEVKSQSVYLANEVIKNFIQIHANTLTLRQKEQTSLEEELSETNSSALLFNPILSVLFGHGNFSFFTTQDSESAKTIITIAKRTLSTKKLTSAPLVWRDQHMLITAVPVMNGSELYGVLLIGKPIASINQLSNTILFAFIILGIFSFLGSVVLGNIIVRNALSPLQELTRTIHSIDLEKLTPAKAIDGSPNDEIVQLVNKFNTMVDRIRGMSQLQKDFISNASHELKTPITTISSSLELMAMDDSEHREELLQLQQTLFSISSLLDQLMQLSKLQSGITPPSENIHIERSLHKIQELYDAEIQKKNLHIQINVPQIATIPLPKEYAQLLLSNLISNAIKYAFDNTTISISCADTNGMRTLSITNTGIGMTQYELSHIFDKFYRGYDAKRKSKGSGVGMSIVQRICELYSLTINFKSLKNENTSVYIRFPILT